MQPRNLPAQAPRPRTDRSPAVTTTDEFTTRCSHTCNAYVVSDKSAACRLPSDERGARHGTGTGTRILHSIPTEFEWEPWYFGIKTTVETECGVGKTRPFDSWLCQIHSVFELKALKRVSWWFVDTTELRGQAPADKSRLHVSSWSVQGARTSSPPMVARPGLSLALPTAFPSPGPNTPTPKPKPWEFPWAPLLGFTEELHSLVVRFWGCQGTRLPHTSPERAQGEIMRCFKFNQCSCGSASAKPQAG